MEIVNCCLNNLNVNDYCDRSYNDVLNFFSEHTSSTGRQTMTRGPVILLNNTFFQERSMNSALTPRANCNGDGMY